MWFNIVHYPSINVFNGSMLYYPVDQIPSSGYMEGIWDTSADLDGWIHNLASSMINVIRTYNQSPDDLYKGTGYQLGIEVNWPWIALPAVLVVSSLVTLVITILRTARSPVEAWKGSPLVLLLMNVDENIRWRASGDMDRHNGITRVVLRTDQSGNWKFKAA